jgi:hypothetical protein
VKPELKSELDRIASQINGLSDELRKGPAGLTPTPEALAQPKWGVTRTEIPILPMTPRGVMFDDVASKAADITTAFNKARNTIPANDQIIADLKGRIDALKAVNEAGSFAPELQASARITSRPLSAFTGASMTARSFRQTPCKPSMMRLLISTRPHRKPWAVWPGPRLCSCRGRGWSSPAPSAPSKDLRAGCPSRPMWSRPSCNWPTLMLPAAVVTRGRRCCGGSGCLLLMW